VQLPALHFGRKKLKFVQQNARTLKIAVGIRPILNELFFYFAASPLRLMEFSATSDFFDFI
jgi:hypothetical protein